MNMKVKQVDIASKGRGLVASAECSQGCEVLHESPLVYVSSRRKFPFVCDHCLAEKESKRCTGCMQVFYCSKQCQKLAWPLHKLECGCLKQLSKSPGGDALLPDSVCLLGRCVLLGKQEGTYGIPKKMAGMVSHADEFQSNTKVVLDLLFVAKKYLGEQVPSDDSTLVELAGKLACNSLHICNAEMQNIGSGIYCLLSVVNHSCQPNCVVTFNGPEAILRTVRSVEAGEELTISYVDLLSHPLDRYQQLLDRYYFQCNCGYCIDLAQASPEWLGASVLCTSTQCKQVFRPDTDSLSSPCPSCGHDAPLMESASQWTKEAQRVLCSAQEAYSSKQGNLKDSLEDVNCCLTGAASHLSSVNITRCQLHDVATDICITLEQWSEALHHACHSLQAYRVFYNACHPLLGVQLFRIGKLQSYLSHLWLAKQSFTEALDILQVTHSSSHSLVCDLQEILLQIERETHMMSDTRLPKLPSTW